MVLGGAAGVCIPSIGAERPWMAVSPEAEGAWWIATSAHLGSGCEDQVVAMDHFVASAPAQQGFDIVRAVSRDLSGVGGAVG